MPKTPRAAATPTAADRPRQPDRLLELPLDLIDADLANPRRRVDASDLEASIREKGIIEPLIVRPRADDPERYHLVAGQRRLKAGQAVGLARAFCVVKDLTDAETLEHALIENLKRADMNPIDEAEGYARLQRADARIYTRAVIAARIGQTEGHIYRRLKLLELEKPLVEAIAEGRLSIGHAEKLLKLPAKLRAEATDPNTGVVWEYSPLLERGMAWIPGREDLRPLHELEAFIREKSALDPRAEATTYLQENLIEQLEPAAAATGAETEARQVASADLARRIAVSADPLARMRLGGAQAKAVPLTPSHWKEIRPGGKACPHTQPAVIAHGGAPRLLDVCIIRSCRIHWPAKKKPATSSRDLAAQVKREKAEADRVAREAAEDRKRRAAERRWQAFGPVARQALAAHLKGAKLSARLVADVVATYDLGRIRRQYGVALTDKTAALVLALVPFVDLGDRPDVFARRAKQAGLKLEPLARKWDKAHPAPVILDELHDRAEAQ